MGGRSVSADRRRAVVAVAGAVAVAACTATSPPPLPPRRVSFPAEAQPAAPGNSAPRPMDLPLVAEAPDRTERYLGWTLTADVLSIAPLVVWTTRPEDVYLAAPALLAVPAIHAAHGELRSAGISLAMRAAMVGLAYAANRWADHQCTAAASHGDFCLPLGPFVLLDLAIVIPVAIDSSFLAQRRRPAPGWERLPALGAVVDLDGRRLLTLSARF